MAKARNFRHEYDKFASSKRAIHKRALLNKYNREHKKYGNADHLDASHKGGKIVGYESEKINRSRREASRLKGSKRKPFHRLD